MPEQNLLSSIEGVEIVAASRRFLLRLVVCLLLTALNIAVAVKFSPPLYAISAHHPLYLAAIVLLFAALFTCLVRVWFIAFCRSTD